MASSALATPVIETLGQSPALAAHESSEEAEDQAEAPNRPSNPS